MSIAQTGNAIYSAIKDDPVALQAVRDEYARLALSIATDPNATAQVTSSTVNGQSFSTSHTMSNGARLKLLQWVVECANRGRAISTTAITYFP